MQIYKRIFFTGVPGSKWSGIARELERLKGFNISDRSKERRYHYHGFTGHHGAYFGRQMEFEAKLDLNYLDKVWVYPGGIRLIKSHDWAYCLDEIKRVFPNEWIMLVYQPNDLSFDWWHHVGGWNINYPSYTAYIDDEHMKLEIEQQNKSILEFADKHNLTWSKFTPEWIYNTFNYISDDASPAEDYDLWKDVKVTMLK